MKTFKKRFSQPAAVPSSPIDRANVEADDALASPEDNPVSDKNPEEAHSSDMPPTFKKKWFEAFKQIFPIYFAVHIAVFIIDALSVLFSYTQPYQFYGSHYQLKAPQPVSILWKAWNSFPHDTPHFIEIAQHGYEHSWLAAYFPLYPFLIRITSVITGNNYLFAALLVSNVAGLVMLMVFYQLVKEDFDHERAVRTVLYFSIFPAAFFFMAGYTETTFISFVLLSFYQMRRGNWWLAGIFGLLATITRNTGVFLALPLSYEYLRQHQFSLKSLRLDVVSLALVPAGLGLYMLYTYFVLGDPLAFTHAQAYWRHALVLPWVGLMWPIHAMMHSRGVLSFAMLRNAIDLGNAFFILVLLILSVVGPWRFPKSYLSYFLFAAIVWIIPLTSPLNPPNGPLAYQSMSRYMLEVFPAFMLLATLGKCRIVHYTYLMVAGALCFFLLAQFLLGYMVI